jgi:hypothetical protein
VEQLALQGQPPKRKRTAEQGLPQVAVQDEQPAPVPISKKPRGSKAGESTVIPEASPPPKKKSVVSQLATLKTYYTHLTGNAKHILSIIETDKAWDWANTEKTKAELKHILDNTIITEDFGNLLFSSGLPGIKKKYGADEIEAQRNCTKNTVRNSTSIHAEKNMYNKH